MCLVEFKNSTEAADTRAHLWDTQWPEKTGGYLTLSHVTREAADNLVLTIPVPHSCLTSTFFRPRWTAWLAECSMG